MRPRRFISILALRLAALLFVVLALGIVTTVTLERWDRPQREQAELLTLARATARACEADWTARGALVDALNADPDSNAARIALLGANGGLHAGKLPDHTAERDLLDSPAANAARIIGQASGAWQAGSGGGYAAAVRIGSDNDEYELIIAARRSRPFLSGGLAGNAWLAVAVLTFFGATALLTVVAGRWRSSLLRITSAVRNMSEQGLAEEGAALTNEPVALLGRAIQHMRKRLMAQVEATDRQRRTFEALLNQIRDGVIVLDARGLVVLLNPAALNLMGMSPPGGLAACIGLAFERVIPQLDLQRMVRGWFSGAGQPSASAESEPLDGESGRVQIETESGLRHLLAHITELALPSPPSADNPDSAPQVGCVLVLTDITTLVRTIQVKSDFVANASHELRTPLSTIRAAVESLQRMDAREDAELVRRFIDVIDRQSRRLEELAGDLLDLSRLEGQSEQFTPRSISLTELAGELREHFAAPAESKGVRLEMRAEAARLHASPQLVRLVLDNLIDNAIKFTDPGKCVGVELRRVERGFAFEVRDEGCGIDPADQQRVFERFFQVERARSGVQRGTGLGLAIVRHAVRTLGGSVELHSAPRMGTRVTVLLPPQPPLHGQAGTSGESNPDRKEGANSGRTSKSE